MIDKEYKCTVVQQRTTKKWQLQNGSVTNIEHTSDQRDQRLLEEFFSHRRGHLVYSRIGVHWNRYTK